MENYKGKFNSPRFRNSFSLKYYRTDFVDATETDTNKKELVDRSTEMLCLKENCFNLEFENKDFRVYSGENDKLLSIIYDDDGINGCKTVLKDLNKKTVIYIFSLDDSNKEEEFTDIAGIIEIRPIPASILNVYRRLFR
jgi:adenine-specific DNA-methyltransferase